MQGDLGLNLQDFSTRNGIAWMNAADVAPSPSTPYIVVVVNPDDATLIKYSL